MLTGLANCPLDRVLTSKNLIYLLNLQITLQFSGLDMHKYVPLILFIK